MSKQPTVPMVPGEIPRYLRKLYPLEDLVDADMGEEELMRYQGVYDVIRHLEVVAKRQEQQQQG